MADDNLIAAGGGALAELARAVQVLDPPAAARASPGEDLLSLILHGEGTVSADARGVRLVARAFSARGEADGTFRAVLRLAAGAGAEGQPWPGSPAPPLDRAGEVETIDPAAHFAAEWTSGKGDELSCVGPLVLHRGGGGPRPTWWLTGAAAVCGGSGRFHDARGVAGTALVAHLDDLRPGASFPFTAVQTYRVVAAGAPRPGDGGQPQPQLPQLPQPSRFVDVEGARMHYLEAGSGPPILFLHGNPSWSYMWRNVIPHLAPLGRCIAPDLIGMGLSSKPDVEYDFFTHARYLEAFIRALDLRHVTLVLHDWGSGLGFHYAMRYADNVRGIAFFESLLRPYASWDDFPAADAPPQLRETFRLFRSGDEGGPGWQAVVVHNVFLEQLVPAVMGRALSAEEMDMYRLPFRSVEDRRVIWSWVRQLPIGGRPSAVSEAVFNYSQALCRSTVPKLLLHAQPGAITTAEHVQWARDHLPELKVVDLGEGLHFLAESSPDALGRELATWVRELDGAVTETERKEDD